MGEMCFLVMSPDVARGSQGAQGLQQVPRVSSNTALRLSKGDDGVTFPMVGMRDSGGPASPAEPCRALLSSTQAPVSVRLGLESPLPRGQGRSDDRLAEAAQ